MNTLLRLTQPCRRGLFLICFNALGLSSATAQDLRIATYNTELSRTGPGLLLRDILSGDDPQVEAILDVLATLQPDVLALQRVDHDTENHALHAFQAALAQRGHPMPFAFAGPPNTGRSTGLDMDGNGTRGEAQDAQGYGRFTGQGGMAVLSTLPLGPVRDFTDMLWSDLPQAIPPTTDGHPFPSPEAFAGQRLSHVAHWDITITPPDQPPFHLLTFHATTPVFDGAEDRNGRRNHDEIMFWRHYLDGALPWPAPQSPVVIAGNANLDPIRGEGRHEAIQTLLSDPRLQDPHRDSDTLATVDWPDPKPGDLRVSYVLPSTRFDVTGSGVFWPAPGTPLHDTVTTASRHRLVWVDIRY